MARLSCSLTRTLPGARCASSRVLLGSVCLLLLIGTTSLAGATSTSASAAKFSARLSKASFSASQASSVKLVCKFPGKSGSFSYLLTHKIGKKWQTVKSVKKVSYRKGSYTMTVKKVFAGKAVKLGSYRLKISAGGASKLLAFKVVKAPPPPPPPPPPPTGSKPANSSLPTISGTVRQGQTLTASAGVWTGSPTSYAYRWDRCTASGAICADIGGATSSTYALVVADVGSTIRIIVTASNSYGSASATSSQTAVVTGLPVSTGLPPANTSLPTISGTDKQGQTLTASNGSWSESPTGYAYQWRRCDSSGNNCSDIASASSGTYALVLADVDGTVRVAVTASNSYGSASATSSQTAVVTGLPPVNSALPTISGTAKQGQTLTASNGSWSSDFPITYAYQWRRCDSSGNNCSDIASASSGTYALASADVDGTVRVAVTASNSYGSASATSSQTAAVSAIVAGVSSGATHTCALLSGGKVECWGMNDRGQLGNGTQTDSPTPVLVSGITNAVQVSAGTSRTCALLSDHTVKCWGDGARGELGTGSYGPGVFSSTPATVLGIGGAGTLSNVTQVSAGDAHVCALLSDSTVACWGYDGSGELGNGSTNSTPYSAPVLVKVSTAPTAAAFTGFAQVSAGNSSTCAVVSTDGGVYCWGSDTDGKIGNNGTNDSPVPTRVVKTTGSPALTGASQVSARKDHACALVGSAVWCWGDNGNGELGNNDHTHTNSSVAVQVTGVGGTSTLSGATQISAGKDHNCALVSGGGVDCWGGDYDGQLGNNSFNPSDYPVQVSGISTAAGLSAGLTHTCALLSDHSVECWGDNFGDQLGIGKLGHSAVPVSVSGISDASAVSSGFDHACAIRSGGTVWCWGRNYNGQLGNNSTTDSSTPVQVKVAGGTGLLTGVSQISAGGSHTCALILDDPINHPENGGKVWCWGSDGNGELGNGYSGNGHDSSTPAQVVIGPTPGTAALDHVIQISAGGSHTCALSQGETVSCWGRNYEGQLGNGALIHTLGSDKSTPVPVVSLTNVINISAGYGHTCAVLSTGSYTISCWGANSYGQLGHGNTTDSSSPVQVYTIGTTALIGVSKVSAGSFHTCALLSSGNARCWGHNADGQLGNGTPTADNPFAGQVNASGTTALTGVSNVSAGPDHSCALLSTNTVDCWGYNYSGQLGIGTLADSYYPAVVSSLANVAQLSAGGVGNNGFSCALISGGAVKCWGSDYDGELGDGGIGLSLVPVGVVGLP